MKPSLRLPLLLAGAVLLVIVLALAGGLSRTRAALRRASGSTITHSVVVERTRAVARLVTSETSVRDVVVYENRRLGSTKRALVVVTGTVQTGIDLERGAEVELDDRARRVRVVLPPARVLGVEVTQLKTYDERRGLWNPFRPSDRDTIYQLAREQLIAAAGELGVTRHAEESAARLLRTLLATDGYRVEVVFPGRPAPEDRAGAPEMELPAPE